MARRLWLCNLFTEPQHNFAPHAQKRLLRIFQSNMWPHRSIRLPPFPVRRVYYPLSDKVFVLVSYDLWPFDLDGHIIQSFIRPVHIASYDYPFLSYGWLSHHISITWNGDCVCAVSCDICIEVCKLGTGIDHPSGITWHDSKIKRWRSQRNVTYPVNNCSNSLLVGRIKFILGS